MNGTLYYPVLYVNEVGTCYAQSLTSFSEHCPLQHAELTESFKHYLESNGLKMVLVFHQLYWPLFGVIGKPLPLQYWCDVTYCACGLPAFLALVMIVVSMVTCSFFVRRVRRARRQYHRIIQ